MILSKVILKSSVSSKGGLKELLLEAMTFYLNKRLKNSFLRENTSSNYLAGSSFTGDFSKSESEAFNVTVDRTFWKLNFNIDIWCHG